MQSTNDRISGRDTLFIYMLSVKDGELIGGWPAAQARGLVVVGCVGCGSSIGVSLRRRRRRSRLGMEELWGMEDT